MKILIICFCLILNMIAGSGCSGKDSYSLKEYYRIEQDAMEIYKEGASKKAIDSMNDAIDYYMKLCAQGHSGNNDCVFGMLFARLAFLYNYLGDKESCSNALAECLIYIENVGVRGEHDLESGKIGAFIQVVKDFDRDYGVNWTHNLKFDEYFANAQNKPSKDMNTVPARKSSALKKAMNQPNPQPSAPTKTEDENQN